MKIRAGFVSNSSTASFIVKTRLDSIDMMLKDLDGQDAGIFALPQEKIDLLKEYGFVPITDNDPFRKEMNTCMGDYNVQPDTEDDTILGFWIICNHLEVMELLVANNIPFKSAAHYSHHLYSYELDDDYIYVLNNFGIEYMNNPKDLEERMNDPQTREWMDFSPMHKIKKEDFLKGYDEESSRKLMTE